jgi:hypothetical protein
MSLGTTPTAYCVRGSLRRVGLFSLNLSFLDSWIPYGLFPHATPTA